MTDNAANNNVTDELKVMTLCFQLHNFIQNQFRSIMQMISDNDNLPDKTKIADLLFTLLTAHVEMTIENAKMYLGFDYNPKDDRESSSNTPRLTKEQEHRIYCLIDLWYLDWKDKITSSGHTHTLGIAKEHLKKVLCPIIHYGSNCDMG